MFLALLVNVAVASFTDENGVVFDSEACTQITGLSTSFSGNLEIPDTVTSIAEKACEGATITIPLKIPGSVTNIGKKAFMNCNVPSIEMTGADHVQIEYEAFDGVQAGSLTFEGNGVFGGDSFDNTGIQNVEITAKGNVVIEKWAFNAANCRSIVIKGSGVTQNCADYWVHGGSFNNMDMLTNFEVHGSNHHFDIFADDWSWTGKGVNIVIDVDNFSCSRSLVPYSVVTTLVLKGSNHSYTDVLLADAYGSGTVMTAITINVAGIKLPGNVVSGDAGVESMNIDGASFTELWTNAFASMAFEGVWSFNESMVSIPRGVFANTKTEGVINIPAGVTSIAEDVFLGCTGITGFTMADNGHFVCEDGVILNAERTEIALFPQGKTGNYEVKKTISMIAKTEMTPNSLSTITAQAGSEFFTSIDGVLFNIDQNEIVVVPGKVSGSLDFPDTLSHIGAYAFANCSNITDVWFRATRMTLGIGSFSGWKALTGVYFVAKEGDVSGVDSAFGESLPPITYDAEGSSVSGPVPPTSQTASVTESVSASVTESASASVTESASASVTESASASVTESASASVTESASASAFPSPSDESGGKSVSTGAIVGSVIGVIVVLVAVAVGIFIWYRRKNGGNSDISYRSLTT